MADEGRSRQDIWASEASLSLLGPVRLTGRAGEDLTPRPRKTRALLAILALARSPVPRSRLVDLLWGDRGEEQAKASLRQAIYELRDLSNAGLLTATRESVAVGPKRLWTDIADIEGAKIEPAAAAEILQEIDWPPLADLDDITPEFDEWLRDERSRIATILVHGNSELGEEALRTGDATAARTIADALQRIDPLDERVARIGARADLALGDRTAAHRRITRLEQRLRDEIGVDLSTETRAFLKEPPSPSGPGKVSQPPPIPRKPVRPRWLLAALGLILVIVIVGAALLLRSNAAQANPTVAVLPFEDVGQRSQGYFASGVSDEILNLLSHENGVRVLGRVSAEEIAGQPDSLEMARKLGITHLLDGSVRTAGKRVLVIVTLTRVSDGAQMWSERYERQLGDIFAVQGDIASTVASRLSRSFGKPVTRTTSPEVYDRYLAARQLLRERREVTLKEADRLLREAIRLDPNYAPAYAELALEVMLRSDHPTSYGSIPIDQARAEAFALASKAIQLDPNLGDAYAALGFVDLQDKKSAPYYRKAVELSPQRPDYHRWLATSLNQQFKYDEAVTEYRRAIQIDPLWYINYEHLAGAYTFIGWNEEARTLVGRFLALSTDDRAKLLVLRGYANNSLNFYDNYRYSKALYERLPEERTMRFNYASALSELGERRQSAELMNYDPIANALLRADWGALSDASLRSGRNFWDRYDLWGVGTLLVASGHSDVIVRLYDDALPLINSGVLDWQVVAAPATIAALRDRGRTAEADRVQRLFAGYNSKFPNAGLGGLQKRLNIALVAALSGRNGEALDRLEEVSERGQLVLAAIPAMSLRNNPYFRAFRNDPRLVRIDERLRGKINAERAKAGLAPISSEEWISDPKTLLTKN